MKQFAVYLETTVEARDESSALTEVFRRISPRLFVNTRVEKLEPVLVSGHKARKARRKRV
jgi:hypothetical protein